MRPGLATRGTADAWWAVRIVAALLAILFAVPFTGGGTSEPLTLTTYANDGRHHPVSPRLLARLLLVVIAELEAGSSREVVRVVRRSALLGAGGQTSGAVSASKEGSAHLRTC